MSQTKSIDKRRETKSSNISPRNKVVNLKGRPRNLQIKTDQSEANARRISLKYDYANSEDESASPQHIIKKSKKKVQEGLDTERGSLETGNSP